MLARVAETVPSPILALASLSVDVVEADCVVAGVASDDVEIAASLDLADESYAPLDPSRYRSILSVHQYPQYCCHALGCVQHR